jgi:hypothetical protein
MPTFLVERRIPSCLVTKGLLRDIEGYLQVEMGQKFGEMLGDEITYEISIKEKIGTETLTSVSDYSPSTFSDGTKEIDVHWENGHKADCRLYIAIDLDGDRLTPTSNLTVKCTAPTARETAIGVRDAILRLLESHRTYNWIFNPSSEFPIVLLLAGWLALTCLIFGSVTVLTNRQKGFYLLSGAVIAGWIFVSASFFRPRISFDSRRQQLLDRLWRYFSLGTFGFVVFGTLFPLIRKAVLGF